MQFTLTGVAKLPPLAPFLLARTHRQRACILAPPAAAGAKNNGYIHKHIHLGKNNGPCGVVLPKKKIYNGKERSSLRSSWAAAAAALQWQAGSGWCLPTSLSTPSTRTLRLACPTRWQWQVGLEQTIQASPRGVMQTGMQGEAVHGSCSTAAEAAAAASPQRYSSLRAAQRARNSHSEV